MQSESDKDLQIFNVLQCDNEKNASERKQGNYLKMYTSWTILPLQLTHPNGDTKINLFW